MRCRFELTVTTREPAVVSSRSNNRPVSANGPRWFVAHWSSTPSAVTRGGVAMTPALFTSTSSRSCRRSNSAAAALTDGRSATSTSRISTEAPGAAPMIRSAASFALAGLRQPRST